MISRFFILMALGLVLTYIELRINFKALGSGKGDNSGDATTALVVFHVIFFGIINSLLAPLSIIIDNGFLLPSTIWITTEFVVIIFILVARAISSDK